MPFPTVTGYNLAERKFTLPADFEGEVNLVLIAFQRYQQILVNTWLPIARQLAETYGQFRYYELPTISRAYGLARFMIDGGMRAGIPDPVARATTITLYIDKKPFRAALELPHEETIYAVLVDRQGQMVWRAEGEFTEEMGTDLEGIVRRILAK